MALMKKKRRSYTVYVNLRKFKTVWTKAAVWKIIGEIPFGALYEVHDSRGNIVEEFIPF